MSQGVMYVEILPSTKGIGKAVEKDTTAAFKGADKESQSFLSRVGTGIKRVGLGIAAVAGTVAAIAIKGGITRALNIEDAQAKLRGLGHDTQSVEAIMTNALAAVKGTAFGLDAAATTAAAAVASGIKPGQELERYLRLTADAATIAGVSMEEMGSIINKVQAKGKAQMEDLNRLTERGIPIMQMLADEYGVTAEEMSDMVSRGEVDAERFRKALENNVGGAALESGNTTRGAFANMRAALSRLGLAFVGDGLSGATTFFNELTVIFDGLAERIGPWVEKFQEKLGGMFQIEGMGENFLNWLDGLFSKIAQGPIPQLLIALQPLIPVLGEIVALIGPALGDAFRRLSEALVPILPQLADELVPALVELAPLFAELLAEIMPLLPSIVELAVEVLPALVEVLRVLIPFLTLMAASTIESMTAFVDLFDVLKGDKSLAEWNATLAESSGLYGKFAGDVQSAGWTIGTTLAQVKVGFETIRNTIVRVMGEVSASVAAKWNEVAGNFALGVTRAVSFVMSLPGRVRSAVAGAGTWLVQAGRDILQGLINGINSMIDRVLSAVRSVGNMIPGPIKAALGIASPSRVFRDEVGKMIGLGLLEGIEDTAIQARIGTSVQHMIDVPSMAGVGARPITQENTVYMQERDPRLLWRQLGRELTGALA